MPYILEALRYKLQMAEGVQPETAGELNYCITQLVKNFLGEKPNYERYNAAIGALESAKLELYRRKVVPYEDLKIQENGDVY